MEKIIVFAAAAVCAVLVTMLVCLVLYLIADFIRMLLDRPGNMPQLFWGILAAVVFVVTMLVLSRYGFRVYDHLRELIHRLPGLGG